MQVTGKETLITCFIIGPSMEVTPKTQKRQLAFDLRGKDYIHIKGLNIFAIICCEMIVVTDI
jgi:hypothetical protein